jgi:hypothetical protein
MNATDTDRRTIHALCDHPATKVARAACRRATRQAWIAVTREDVVKGDTIRITNPGGLPVEGTLLGWGAKRLIVRNTSDERVTFEVGDRLVVEAPGA